MKTLTRCLVICAVFSMVLLCVSAPVQAQASRWKKITGDPQNYSGVADGILGDRQNAYAWSMELHGGYLYLGTARDVVGLVLTQLTTPPNPWPDDVPVPTDLRGRIYRMSLSTGQWEPFYTPPPSQTGMDLGYRMMKTFKAVGCSPVLYVGSMGFPTCRLMAIDSSQQAPVSIFATGGMSVRAIAEYKSQLFWASEVDQQPTIWYSCNPLGEFKKNPNVEFDKIEVPSDWFTGEDGAEIMDMVPYNGVLYVFFCNHDWANAGFWCAKLSKVRNTWKWQLVVGDKKKGARYPAGMGRIENGGATPYVFKGKMYVGTLSTTMWRFLMTGDVDINNIPPTGTQIFRFDTRDNWERVMPPAFIPKGQLVDALNGFANPLNLYLWRFGEQNGKLYAGTFDARTALDLFGQIAGLPQIKSWNPAGFDVYSTKDGVLWLPEAVGGFGDPWNYGARTFLTDPKTGNLYLGTANPFYGCQVWMRKPG